MSGGDPTEPTLERPLLGWRAPQVSTLSGSPVVAGATSCRTILGQAVNRSGALVRKPARPSLVEWRRGAGPMSMSEERPASNLRLTPYQLTLSALIVPWRLHMLLNAVTGVAFGLVAGPALAMLWVAGLTLGDAVLQQQYRRLD